MRIQMYQTERWAEQSWPSLNDWSSGTRNSSNDKLSAMAETAAVNELPSTHFTVSHTQNANYYVITFSISAVLRHCWLGVRKSVRSVKKLSDEVLVWLCLERGADCFHMVQLMPLLPKIPSLASFKSRLALPFWYRLTKVVLEQAVSK